MYGNLHPTDWGAEMVVIILVGLIASGKVCPLLLCEMSGALSCDMAALPIRHSWIGAYV